MDDLPKQENQPEITIPQPEYPKQVQTAPKKPTYISDFPYCPVRVGRVYGGDVSETGDQAVSAVPTCGFREVTLKECLECLPQHMMNENKILTGKKLVKNSEDIRELKRRLELAEENINGLKEIIGNLIHGTVIETEKQSDGDK